MNAKRLKYLKNMIVENDGLTLSSDGEIANLKTGYMVSLSDYEKEIKNIKFLKLAQVKSYLKKAKKLNAFVGFWVDNNKIYLDLSINVSNKKEALKIAKINNQLAIFDCKNLVSVYLNDIHK